MGVFHDAGRMSGSVKSCAWRAAVCVIVLLTIGVLGTVPAVAQGNPLDPPKQPVVKTPSYFEGDGLILSLEKHDAATGRAEGRIMLGENVFPYAAMRAADGSLRGEFTASGNAFPFTATMGESSLTFRTGDTAYTLAPVERPSRALPGDPAPANPLGNKPGPSNTNTTTGANGAAPQETLQQAVDAWGRNDMTTVLKTLRPLADRGHLGASYLVGILLADGAEGVQQDPKAALRYVEHAANHKHPGALFMLGEMYFWGHGTEQNEQKGLDAITAAAKLGEPAAMANLGTFLYDGTTVTENVTDGLAWLLIAEKRGDPFARETVAKMKQDRNITQANWDSANKRVPEIEAVIASGPMPDYLLDFNRSEPLERRADDGGGEQPAPATTLAGKWTGTATERFQDGTTGRYPAQLDLRATSGNAYAGQLSFETTATMEGGQNVTIRGSAQLTGTLANNQLSMRTDNLSVLVVETNQTHSLGAGTMTLDLRDNRLTGRIGNDQIGWTELDLTSAAVANNTSNTNNNNNNNNNAPALAGTWSGTGRDQAEDGTPLTFPISINLSQGGDGTITGDLRSVVNYPVGQGQTVAVELRGRFTGRAGANGMLELHAREVIASANGQSESIGAQSLRLQSAGPNRMTGQVGNDMEGWTPIELERQGGAPSQQNDPRGGGGAGGFGGGGGGGGGNTPAVRGNTGNMPGTIVFRKVELRDSGMDNMVSHSLLVPKDWQVQGGQQWSPQTYRDFVHLNLRISAGDGRELAVYPGGFYEDSNIYEVGAQMGAQNARPRPGQVLGNGLTHMPVPQSVSQYVTNILMPMHRPQAQNMQVVSTTPLDSLRQQLDEVLAPVRQNMAQGDQQLRQMGGQIQSSLTTIAERVRVRYQENGRAFEEDVWVLGTVNHSVQQTQGMPPVHMWYWRMMDPRGVRAPAGQLDDARPLLEAISLSIQPNPRYQAIIMHLQHKINMKELEALAKRGEIARQGREEAWQIYQSGVKEQQASTDRMHDSFNEYIQDIDRFQDLDGSTVRLPSLYSYVYSNNNGEYILTNEPTFNPNDQPNRTTQWERINPQR